MKRWVIAKTRTALAETLARELHLALPYTQVLINRGYRTANAALSFLNPQLRQLGDPFETCRICCGGRSHPRRDCEEERIVIYGDYDVDGVTSARLLQRVLQAAGRPVANFLPQRAEERLRSESGWHSRAASRSINRSC